ncbi:MAG: GntR family transcriptional regulator [Propionibacteriaceae bacterium]|jgi:DNA-binding FadR family transcriptional regulator|nr:GntR family transcriptional regulator [Propionibacteriaceae bacterium]
MREPLIESVEEPEESRKYEAVLRHIENGIIDGSYRAGDSLPPERDLAASLNVGRSAVREAMRVLQTQGIIEASTGRGGGTRVVPQQGDALARILRLYTALHNTGMVDLIETRVALERVSAAEAAMQASKATLSNLNGVMAEMREANSVEAFNPLDTLFHVMVARAGRNGLIAELTVAIREAVRRPILLASLSMDDWTVFKETLCQEHGGILLAISSHQPDLAADRMEAHIRSAYATLKKTGM